MRYVKSLLLLVVLTGFLSSCGLSGPLYLPDGSESIKPDTPEDTDKQINKKKTEQVH